MKKRLFVASLFLMLSALVAQAGQKTVQVRGVELGKGLPKICVPITSETTALLLEEVAMIKNVRADVVEWRVDYFNDVDDLEKVRAAAKEVRAALGETPLLFTFRTKQEGGQREFSTKAYVDLKKGMAASGLIDLIDFEMFTGDDECEQVIAVAHANSVKVVMSSHDIQKPPAQNVIVERLLPMAELGADIPKIAVMARTPMDVLTLLAATVNAAAELEDNCPIITMSMSSLGTVSRVSGEVFGSCLSFGTVKRASAPGQLTTEDLWNTLNCLRPAR